MRLTVDVELVKSFGKDDDKPNDKVFVVRRLDNHKLLAAIGCLNGYSPDYTMQIEDSINDVEFAKILRLVAAGKAVGIMVGTHSFTYVPNWTLMVDCVEMCDTPLRQFEKWAKDWVNGKAKPKRKATTKKKP